MKNLSFCESSRNCFVFFGGWGSGVGSGVGGGSGWWGVQGGCERIIEVFMKIQKKIFFF